MAKDEVKDPFGDFKILNVRSDFPRSEEVETIEGTKTPDIQEDTTKTKKETVLEVDQEEINKLKAEEAEKKKSAKEAAEVEAAIKKAEEDRKKAGKKPEDLEDTKDKDEDNTSVFKPFVETLAEKGIVSYDPEKFEDTEDGLVTVIADTIKKEIEGYKDSKSDAVKKFIEFTDDGGNPKDFLDIYYGSRSFENFKIDNEESQKIAIREGLKLSGWEDSEIEEEISLYEDSGKLETKAKSHLSRLQKAETEMKEDVVKQQKEAQENQRKAEQEYFENLKKDWYSKEDIKGFKLTPKLKDEVWNHMTKPVDRKTGLTQLAINNQKNKDAQFLYAYLDKLDWNIDKLEKQAETKATSKLADKLRNYTDTRGNSKTGISDIAKPKGEKDDNPFELFSGVKP